MSPARGASDAGHVGGRAARAAQPQRAIGSVLDPQPGAAAAASGPSGHATTAGRSSRVAQSSSTRSAPPSTPE